MLDTCSRSPMVDSTSVFALVTGSTLFFSTTYNIDVHTHNIFNITHRIDRLHTLLLHHLQNARPYMYIYTYIYIYIYTYVYIHIYIYTYIHIHLRFITKKFVRYQVYYKTICQILGFLLKNLPIIRTHILARPSSLYGHSINTKGKEVSYVSKRGLVR